VAEKKKGRVGRGEKKHIIALDKEYLIRVKRFAC
jgi:hypothetical protein